MAALLQSIFSIYKIEFNQHEIGKLLGGRTPLSSLEQDAELELGIVINCNKIDAIFKKKDLHLRSTFFPCSNIFDGELDLFIGANLGKGSHIIVAYDYAYLHKKKRSDIGHVSLIKEITPESVSLLDPGPEHAGEYIFRIDDLFIAMKSRNGGVLVIEELLPI